MPFFTYILESERDGRYYIGYTSDLDQRLHRHNAGYEKATKYLRPWTLVYCEEYTTKQEALAREKQLKRWKKRSRLERLIKS